MMTDTAIFAHDIADTIASMLTCTTAEDRANKTLQLEYVILDLVGAIVAEASQRTETFDFREME